MIFKPGDYIIKITYYTNDQLPIGTKAKVTCVWNGMLTIELASNKNTYVVRKSQWKIIDFQKASKLETTRLELLIL